MTDSTCDLFLFEEEYTLEIVSRKLGKSLKKVEKRLLWFTSARDNLRHTVQYILRNMYFQGFDWYLTVPKGLILKEDFIEEYYKSRYKSNKTIFNYDFSKLPNIIPNRMTKVEIFVNEVSTKTKKVIGPWKTTYSYLITRGSDNISCAGMASKEKMPQFIGTDEFIRTSKERFPGKFGYDKTEYINSGTKVILKCLTCGEYFEQLPGIHLNSPLGVCPACAQEHVRVSKIKTQEEFLQKMEDIYGDTLDFSKAIYKRAKNQGNNEDKVIVINPKNKEERLVSISHLLTGKFHFDGQSSGETFIFNALKELGLEFEQQFMLREKDITEITSIRKRVFIDFVVKYNKQTYFIEYNGKQHYQYDLSFHRTEEAYLSQLKRDEAVKLYCERNNIQFVEIPYIVNTRNKIEEFLDKVILHGINPNTLIDYKSLYK